MRKKLLLGLGLSLGTAIFAACGDPGDAATAGDYDDETGLEDGGAPEGDGGVDGDGAGSRPFGGVGDLGGGSSSRSRAARAALAMGGAFDVATLEALARGRAIPFVTATNGTVIGSTIGALGAVTASKYSAYLDLTGFANTASATPDLAGLIIRVNSGTTAPVTGCGTAGTFATGTVDQGTLATPTTSFAGGDFSLTTGAGSVRIDGLTIPTGTTAPYAVRICSKDSAGTVGLGTAYTFNVTTDIAKPADGDIGTTTATAAGVATIPISGFTDDRAIDHLEVRVEQGLVNPASSCSAAGDVVVADITGAALATAGVTAGVPYGTVPTSAGSFTISGLTAGQQYSVRVCAVDVAGNTAAGATGRVTVKTTNSSIPTSPTFTAITSAVTATSTLSETIFNTTSVQATTVAYAAASLTVQCPNPLATATSSDAELGTFTRTSPPFTAGTCSMEPTVVCSGPRCTATSVGVTDLCPKSGKKLALAITCKVATQVPSAAETVGTSTLDSLNASVPASLVLTCPNPADTISALTVDYGDPDVTAAGVLTANPECTTSTAFKCTGGTNVNLTCTVATRATDCPGGGGGTCAAGPPAAYTAAKAALDTACLGNRSCTIPQGLAATAVVPGVSTGGTTELICPTRKATAAVFTCTQTYITSPAVRLEIDGALAVGTEICISNAPITSAGATALTRGDCGTGWLALATVDAALAAGTHSHTLSGGDGLKTVYFKVHDATFNESAVVTKQVRMDTIAPVRQGMLARADNLTPLALTNRIYWNRFTESGSGIASYKLVYTSDGTLPPTDCSATTAVKVIGVGTIGTARGWTLDAAGTAAVRSLNEPPTAQLPFLHSEEYTAAGVPVATSTPLSAGLVYTYRVCATDRAGRSSTLAVSTATVAAGPTVSGTATDFTPVTYAPGATSACVAAPSYTAPTLGGSFTLQDGGGAITALTKNWSNSIYVDAVTSSLTTPVAGGGAPYQYCFSRSNQASSCTTSMWKTSSTTIVDAGNVGGGDTLKTLFAHVRDQYRNVAQTSTVSATIYLDRTAPTTPTFTAVAGSPVTSSMVLSWSAATDVSSGLATVVGYAVGPPAVAASAVRPYRITYTRSASQTTQPVAPASCSDGTDLRILTADQGTRTFTHSLNTRSGYTYAFRLCVYDATGNPTVGVVRTVKAP